MDRTDIKDIKQIAVNMDSKFELPMGVRIGWDGILGFIPGLGDLLTNGASFYILFRGALIGCPASVILRMGINILIDNLIDAIPILGNFLDFAWKSNLKNIALIEGYLEHPQKTLSSSRTIVWMTLAIIFAVVAALIGGTIYATLWLAHLAFGQNL